MVSLLKKLFGGGEKSAAVAEEATAAANEAARHAASAGERAAAAAEKASTAATEAAATAQEAADVARSAAEEVSGGLGGLTTQASALLDGELPDMAQLQDAIGQLSEGELRGALTGAMDSLAPETRGQLAALLSPVAGGSAQPDIALGDPSALGGMLGGLLKSDGGLGQFAGLLGGSEASRPASGGFDVQSLLSNPLAQSVLAAIVPAIMNTLKSR